MSQQEDVIFCKIAIANGFVTEADAQKVLSLCDKREREAGQRPSIGTVFAKYNLLKQQEVQRVYEAVRKRTGAPAGPTTRSRAAGQRRTSGRGSAVKRTTRRQEGEVAAPAGKMDPQTLWMGIGGIVVLLVVLGVITFLVTRQYKASSPGTATASSAPSVADEEKMLAEAKRLAASKPAAPAKAVPVEATKNQLLELQSLIGDLKSMHGDTPAEAVKMLEDFKKEKYEKKNIIVPRAHQEAIEFFTGRVKELEASGGGTGDPKPPEGDAKPDTKVEGAPEKQEAKPKEGESDSDLDKLLEETK